jgi:hypothetical protein
VLVELSPEGKAVHDRAWADNVALADRLGAMVDHDEIQASVVELGEAARMLANMPSILRYVPEERRRPHLDKGASAARRTRS